MTPTKRERFAALVVALSLLIFAAWFQGRNVPEPEASAVMTGPVVRSTLLLPDETETNALAFTTMPVPIVARAPDTQPSKNPH